MYDLEEYYNKNPRLVKRPVPSGKANYDPRPHSLFSQPPPPPFKPQETPKSQETPRLQDGASYSPVSQKKGGKKMFVTAFVFMLIGVIIANLADFPDLGGGGGGHELANAIRIFANMAFSIGVLILGFRFMTWRPDDPTFTVATRITAMILGVVLLALFLTDGFRLLASFG